ncbi:MAG: type I DNA topoisomerase [Spirochaetaceae bacterium]|nr:type I DNA topoisomerase [Spirochaetaceae bacterium]
MATTANKPITTKKNKDKKLIIVESPAKAKTIKKFLGSDYKVLASVGHIRDLPKNGRGKEKLGIDVGNGFAMHYEVIKGKEKVVAELKGAAAEVNEVYLAPDSDREGEAIAWHIKEALELKEPKRITYQSVTKKAVLEAIEKAREIDMNLVNAQQARRALDRLVGFSLSPFLWKKVAKSLSAGRVQSPAVRMVVAREKEIMAFKSEEYWSILANFVADGQNFEADLSKLNGKKYGLGHPLAQNQEQVDELLTKFKAANFAITSIESKEVKNKANAPFITSTLQQAANTYLRYSTKRTMVLAQKLYEGIEIDGTATGLITYMRTDSAYIDPAAVAEAKDFILREYGGKYYPDKPNYYTTKNSQEAHEAIRPTSAELTPAKVKPYLEPDQFKLYDLIWRRFMQSQMVPAIFNNTIISVEPAGLEALFEAKGRVLVFDGHLVLQLQKESDDEDFLLPTINKEAEPKLNNINGTQHFTKPPPRYSEASLVKALEKEGIGRPSTYAPIIQTILERGYVVQRNRTLFATELGMAVNMMLEQSFKDIVDYHFTANMEEQLDNVESGKEDWVTLLSKFYFPFEEEVMKAIKDAPPLKGQPWAGEERCPNCGKELVVRYSKTGAFLGCSDYPTCKGTIPLPGQDKGDADDTVQQIEAVPVACPRCDNPMELKRSRFGKMFYACSKYPECKGTVSIDKEGKPVILPKTSEVCEKCGKPMVAKLSRRGLFLACSGYPDCKNAKPVVKNDDGTVRAAKESEIEVPEAKPKKAAAKKTGTAKKTTATRKKKTE